jgi:hypothetical protein
MQASIVTLTPATKNYEMTEDRKRELEFEKIMDYIESKPVGTPIRHTEFAGVIMRNPKSMGYIIETMVKRGMIVKDYIQPFRIAYHTTRGVKTQKSVPEVVPELTDEELTPEAGISIKDSFEPVKSDTLNEQIIDAAKSYFWSTQDDSLHAFVESLMGAEKKTIDE